MILYSIFISIYNSIYDTLVKIKNKLDDYDELIYGTEPLNRFGK